MGDWTGEKCQSKEIYESDFSVEHGIELSDDYQGVDSGQIEISDNAKNYSKCDIMQMLQVSKPRLDST